MDMNEQPPHAKKPSAESPSQRYEERDASFGALIKWGAGLAVTVAMVVVAMWASFDYFAAPTEKFPAPSLLAGARAPYAGPKLQVHAPRDLKEWRAAEEAVLNGWAWVDPDKGIVRIPVGRAIELLAERGLPPKTEIGGTKP